jgi:DNA polymerase-3 subunit epsilon
MYNSKVLYDLLDEEEGADEGQETVIQRLSSDRPALKIIRCTEEELQAHELTLEILDKSSGASLWRQE